MFNYGLHDQRNAFLWLRRFVAGFGGDPANVTAFGESAGAASLVAHAYAEVPLFERTVLQSGSLLALPPWMLEQHEERYRRLLAVLGIEGVRVRRPRRGLAG